jgi:hypothetical protein
MTESKVHEVTVHTAFGVGLMVLVQFEAILFLSFQQCTDCLLSRKGVQKYFIGKCRSTGPFAGNFHIVVNSPVFMCI